MKNKERIVWIVAIVVLLIASFIVSRPAKVLDKEFDSYEYRSGQYNYSTYLKWHDENINNVLLDHYHSNALDTEIEYLINQDIDVKEIGFSEIAYNGNSQEEDIYECLILFNIVGLKDDKIYSSLVLVLSDYFKELLNQDVKTVGSDYFGAAINTTLLAEDSQFSNSNFIKHVSNINNDIYTLDPLRLSKKVYDNSMVLRTSATINEENKDQYYLSAGCFVSNYTKEFGIVDMYSDYLKLRLADDKMNDWFLTVTTEIYLNK